MSTPPKEMIVVATRTHNPASEYYNHYKHDTPGGITIRIEVTEFRSDELEVIIRPRETDAERKRRLKLKVIVELIDALEAVDHGGSLTNFAWLPEAIRAGVPE